MNPHMENDVNHKGEPLQSKAGRGPQHCRQTQEQNGPSVATDPRWKRHGLQPAMLEQRKKKQEPKGAS